MATLFIKSIVSPVQVGRAAAMAHLQEVMLSATGGIGRVVAVSGEAGVGKSRLVAELKKTALSQRGDTIVLQGRCFETDRTLPYAPLVDLLNHATGHNPGDARFDMLAAALSRLGGSAGYLTRLVPELANQLSDPNPPTLDPEQEKRHLFRALTQLLRELAAQEPLILVIEDLHWSDDLSLECLLYLVRQLQGERVLMLLTYRDDEVYLALSRFLATLGREPNFTQIDLLRLTRDEVAEMLGVTFDLQTNVPASFLDTVYTLTEGNPFFIEEVVKSLMASGEIAYRPDGKDEGNGKWHLAPVSHLRVPRSIQLAVQQRLAQLSPAARQLLYMAAVAGRRFDFVLLARLAKRSEDEMLRDVKELVRAQIVVEESEDVFAFRHALTQQAIYFDLLSRERRAFHLAVGEAGELIYGETKSSLAHLADMVHHFYQARAWEKVARYAPLAGEKAQAMYAPRSVIDYFTCAIEAAQQLGLPASESEYQSRRARAQAYGMLGEFEAARDDHTRALDLARSSGDAQEEWQSLLDLGWLWTARDYAMAGKFFQQAIALARQIGDAARLAQTLNRAGNWHSHAQEPLQARNYHEEALSIFEALQDNHGIAATLDMLGITSYMGADLIGGVAYYERAIKLLRELGDREGLVNSLATFAMRGGSYLLSTTPWVEASLDTCKREGEEAVQIAREIGWRSGEASALNYIGLNVGFRGEFERALDSSSRGLWIASEIGHLQWANSAHLALGSIYQDLFDVASAQQHFEAAHQSANEMGSSFVVMVMAGFFASALIAQGELERAEALLTEATGDDEGMQTIAQRLCWLARADLALAKEDPGSAAQIADWLVATVPGIEQIEDVVIPPLWLLKARALMKMQRLDEAEALLLAARRSAQTHDSRPLLWRIEATMCALYRSQGDIEKSEKVLLSARQIINSLAEGIANADLRATFMAGTQRIIGGFTRSKRRETANFPGSLTRREWDVACYIAEGKSNRIIADTLIVSERTIEKHVENMMSKLNVQSRSQIAVWAAQHASAQSGHITNED